MIWRCAGDFFKVLLKFKMAATDQLKFFGGCKNSKNLFGQFFFQFSHHIPSNIFLKMLPNSKLAARCQLQIFLWAQKLQNLRKEIIQILLSHFPRYGDVQVIF